MITINCFNFGFENKETHRLTFDNAGKKQRGEGLVERPSPGGFAAWADWRGGETGEMPDWMKRDTTAGALDTLGTQVDTRRDLDDIPHPVPPRAKDNLKKRTLDIYGTKEVQDWYINKIKEAIEKMNGDDLHKFIVDHPKYRAKNDHVQWNKDFAALFRLEIPDKYKGQNEETTNRRITAAAQNFLVNFYQNDVFQITQQVVNPWIFIDGRMGPYTVSVLNVYWVKKFGKTSTRKPNPPGDSGLGYDKDYKQGSREDALYAAALHYRDGQIRGPRPKRPGPARGGEDADKNKQPDKTPDSGSPDDKAKARYARLDQAGEDLKNADLKIDQYSVDTNMKLSEALALAYGENARGAANSPKTFRVLNLLARQVGAKVDSMDILATDVLNLTEDGEFSVTESDTANARYRIKIF